MMAKRKGSRESVGKDEPLHDGVGHTFAASAGEWKRVHQDGANLLVQLLAHESPRAMQPCLDRLRLKTEEIRGFFNTHPLDHARDKHDSKDLGQVVGRSLDKLQNFSLRHCSFRIARCHGLRELNDLSLGSLRFESFQLDSRTFAPQPPQSFIHGDAGKPCRKTRIAAKALQMGKGVDIGFLDDIFGFAVVAQDASGDPVKPAIVPLHDSAKRRVITGERTPHEFGIPSEGTATRGAGADLMTNLLAAELDAFQGKRFSAMQSADFASRLGSQFNIIFQNISFRQ
jgi:hypothetical protein